GRTRTDALDGWRVDAAAQLLDSTFTHTLALLDEAGGRALAARAPGRDALWRKGRPHEVVYGSVASMLASGALPLAFKLRLGATYLSFLHRHAADLDSKALERAAAAGLDGESIAAWGRREQGGDFADLLAFPLLTTLYGALPEEVSAGFYHALARQGAGLQVLALRGGASGLCRLLADAVGRAGGVVKTSAAVRAVRTAGAGVEVSGDGWTEAFDAAVVAVPAPAAREIAGIETPRMAGWLDRVRVRPAVTLALLLDRPVGVRWFGLSFARGEARAVATLCAEENKGAGLVPDGRGLLVVFFLPEVGERLFDADADEALRTAAPDLSKVFPGIEKTVRRAKLYRWPHAWSLFGPGYLSHLGALRRGGFDVEGRIAFAGDYLVGPSVEGAVTSGLRAADRLLQALRVDRVSSTAG
ncbi:MAG TPA: FAD-dependent oxidoreductase, partial [Longimicrobium sp.]|nr:FAD-dependent oxidoreductase [Longimicrobium sp.]